MRPPRPTLRAVLAAAISGAVLGACGDTLIDHTNENARRQIEPISCPGNNQIVCGNVCKTQDVGPDNVCGSGCQPCLATSAPQNSTAACNLAPDKSDRFCDWDCNPGFLKTAAGCSAPALVTAGGQFSCATTATTGEVHCWGANDQGQLGPGVSGPSRFTSGKVQSAALVGVTAIAAGPAHACAVVGATVYCWGDATGFGGLTSGATPVEVTDLAGVVTLAAGAKHTCGIGAGVLKCAGAALDGGGAPGLGGTVLDIAAGDSFSCALVADGSPSQAVKCWGADDHGQRTGAGIAGTANGSPATIPFPPGAPAGLVLTHVAAGATHACATTNQSSSVTMSVFCWGDDTFHQLGVNGTGGSAVGPTPSKINKPMSTSAPTVIDGGGLTTCAVKSDTGDFLQCWGGDGIAAGSGSPAFIPGELIDLTTLDPPGAFSVGANHACIVDPAGKLACWGHGTQGQLGNGASGDSAAPVLVVDQ